MFSTIEEFDIFKRIALSILVLLLLLASSVGVWVAIPVTSDRTAADRAVTQANLRQNSKPEYREAYFAHKGTSLHYVQAGQGETILFLHGFPSTWLSFIRQMDVLKSEYRVVAIDGLGAGKSDAPSDVSAYNLENMAAHVLALMEHLGAEKVHLVGHDWGSAFAIGFAQRHPDRILSVTGLSAPPQNVILDLLAGDREGRKTFAYVEQLKKANAPLLLLLGSEKRVWEGAYKPLVDAGHLSATEGNILREATGQPKRLNAHINWYRANIPAPDEISEQDYWPSRDARVTVPALYIWGEDDGIYSKPALNKLLLLSDKSELRVLPDTDHWPHFERADQVTQWIRAHIEKAGDNVDGQRAPQ